MPEIVLTKADQDRTVEVLPGTDLVIALDENPTTGYRWTIEQPLAPGMGLLEDVYAPDTSAIGGGGTRRFRIRVGGSGSGFLSLKRWREWAGDASVTERFTVAVQIRGS